MTGHLHSGLRLVIVAGCLLIGVTGVSAQKRGTITGKVTPAADVIVIATNQVTSRITRTRAGSDGQYSISVRPGAYRLSVAPPHVAKFDNTKSYGEHALIRDDSLENVIVREGQETKIDFAVEKREEKPLVNVPDQEPTGAAGDPSVESDPQSEADRREVRDRWRIGFPEYDRYGDRGARGRDIPFTKGRWWDPYNQNVLKGDYPINGNKLFMILSAVSSTVVELSRAPTPSDVSSARPGSAEFFGQPEQLAVNQIFQFSFETVPRRHRPSSRATGPSRFRRRSAFRIISMRGKTASSISTCAAAPIAPTRTSRLKKRSRK